MDSTVTGSSLVFMHPEITNLDPDSADITCQLLDGLGEVQALSDSITKMQALGQNPYWLDPLTDADGNPVILTNTAEGTEGYGEPMLEDGKPALAKAFTVNPNLGAFTDALSAGVAAVKDEQRLADSTYFVTPSDAPPPPMDAAALAAPRGDELKVKLSREGFNWGAKVEAGDFDPNTRSLPLKIYNNWERLLQVHVQYYADADDQIDVDNHDQDPNAPEQAWRSTKNSEYLTYVSDMPMSYGVPWAWDANYSEATITLPQDANYAQLLICGPGSVADMSQWRQYMHNDSYGDQSFPDECQWPLILTYVFDIGIPAIMAGFDACIAGGDAVNSYKKAVKYSATAAQTICKQALDGFATFGDLGAYLQNKEKQPSTGTGVALGQMATIIPTMLWGGDYQDANYQLWMQAAALVTWMIIEWAAVKAIPILGQVFGALAFLGDLVQIATSVVEMCMSPWVFDCKVQILYDATITLQKDDKDSTFPKGAGGAKYTVTMVTDGTDQTRSVTGSIADARADPITLTFPDVPISRTVQYVLHIYDSNGSLIGKGSSAALPNNDTTKLPRAVTLVTEEQMKPITSKTTFVRQDTLQYDPALAKYHWASGVAVAATRTTTDPGLLELDQASIGTVSGMLGAVWRDTKNQYWVRNSPSVEPQDDATKTGLGVLQQLGGPYSRQPHVIFDRLSPDLTNGNNFLLEPQSSGGYLVRRLALSPNGGKLTWQANQAWGHFPLDLDAVTHHPAGFILGVHTTTGRLHKLELPKTPAADNDHPVLAQFHAGTGNRAGLTQQPNGICVALDGTIVLLEPGAHRMQAFDIGGNPVQYFGSGTSKSSFQTLHGSTSDHRLGIGVDGAGYFYVLTYSSNGQSANNYRVDVYAPDGTFIVAPTGINAATFDVDYWRNLFTVNYAALTTTTDTTKGYVDPAIGGVQPSVSIFVPTTPA